ncbi:uncharacterized protein SCHCODRAFT_02551241 [Schizophyllum commune H4-8]|nr:uncharacterized protein SCHCODRAFT_02551241 [Schizophyllum commune H4-8]KAI5888459.1 hypothetical protein SCHCODRAFT_02551241 [Schizophyllum commune H4-8]
MYITADLAPLRPVVLSYLSSFSLTLFNDFARPPFVIKPTSPYLSFPPFLTLSSAPNPLLCSDLPSCAALPLIDIPRLPPHAYPTPYDAARGRPY